jgi:hypothetical protein
MLPDPALKATADRCVKAISASVVAMASGDRDAALKGLSLVAGEIWPGMPHWDKPAAIQPRQAAIADSAGRSFSKQRSAEIFVRDQFQCRYCGQLLFAVPMLSALSSAFPDELPYVNTYKTGMMHPAYWLVGAEADHLIPGSRGGLWTEPENHVTACVLCNTRKGNHLVEELGIPVTVSKPSAWDGLIGNYRDIWSFAGEPNPRYHEPWIQAFEAASWSSRSEK